MTPHVPAQRERRRRPTWLLTFTDLVALLLAFFVMLFATLEVEVTRWAALIESLSQSFNPDRNVAFEPPDAIRKIKRLPQRRAIDLSYLETLLRDAVRAEPSLSTVIVHSREDRLVLVLPSDRMFAPGGAVPVAASRLTLETLGQVLRRIPNGIDIFGHTDPRPAVRSAYGSNWSLSVARAVAVANELKRAGYRRPMMALGFAATRFADLPRSLPLSRRYDMARRVDIVIRPTKGGGA